MRLQKINHLSISV